MGNDLAIPGDLSPMARELCDMIIATAGMRDGDIEQSFAWFKISRSLGAYATQHYPDDDSLFALNLASKYRSRDGNGLSTKIKSAAAQDHLRPWQMNLLKRDAHDNEPGPHPTWSDADCIAMLEHRGRSALERFPEAPSEFLAAVTERFLIMHLSYRKLLLSEVPSRFRSLPVCMAGYLNLENYESVPEHLRISDLIQRYFQASPHLHPGYYLDETAFSQWPAVEDLDDAMLRYCVSAIPQNIRFIPRERLTPDLCLLAVKIQGRTLGFVPEEWRTRELCTEALYELDAGDEAWEHIPQSLKTPDMTVLNALWNGDTPADIDFDGNPVSEDSTYDEALNLLRLARNPRALRHCRAKHLNEALIKMCVSIEGDVLEHVPAKFMTPEVCVLACLNDRNALLHVPREMLTDVVQRLTNRA